MTEHYLRVYQSYKLDEIEKHLLIMGDLSADCGACHELGLDPYSTQQCPHCGAQFRYVASRRLEAHPGERFQFCKRMREKRPELIILDYSDYTKSMGQKKARDFFG